MDSFLEKELFYLLALMRIEGVGPISARRIITKYKNISDLFNNKTPINFDCPGVSNIVFDRIKKYKDFHIIEKEIQFIEDNNIDVLLFSDVNFPSDLKECYDAPFMLFSKGKIDFNNDKIISIVGTRNISAYGIGFLKEFIQDLKNYNPLIVSGFAYGVDILSHLNAIDNKLQTVAVLGHGLHEMYPKKHKKYFDLLLENGGFITEFLSWDVLNKENFIKRNRIVAGLSKATIIIESAIKGGSLSTARFANDYNRDVFALPGRVSDVFSAGCNYLIKTNQASLINSAADLVYLLNWDDGKKVFKEDKFYEFPTDLSADEFRVVLYLIENGPQILDVIAIDNQLVIHKLNSMLLNLELRNIVIPLPGKLFDLVR